MYALLTLKIGEAEAPTVKIRINGLTLEPTRVVADHGFATYIFASDVEIPPEEPEQPAAEEHPNV